MPGRELTCALEGTFLFIFPGNRRWPALLSKVEVRLLFSACLSVVDLRFCFNVSFQPLTLLRASRAASENNMAAASDAIAPSTCLCPVQDRCSHMQSVPIARVSDRVAIPGAWTLRP